MVNNHRIVSIYSKVIMSARKFASGLMPSTMKTLYLDATTADIQFDFSTTDGESERVPAHKLLLSAASVVFRNMFNALWKRKKVISITDTSAAAFREFLQIFYLTDIELSPTNVTEVIGLAKLYDVVEGLNICARFLEDNLTDDNVCMAYELAIQSNQDELKRLCEASISINTEAVLKSPGFTKCDQKTLGRILKLDTLSSTETDVFDACMAWVKTASKQDTLTKEIVQAHLGDAFYDIRFGSMEMKEFSNIFKSHTMTSLFSAKEHKDIVQMITTKTHESKYFNGNCRQSDWNQLPTLKFSRNFSFVKDPDSLDDIEVTTFSSNEPLLLREIVCPYIKEYIKWKWVKPVDYNVQAKMTIFELPGSSKNFPKYSIDENARELYSDDIVFEGDNRTYIPLEKPVIIRRGFKYQIRFEINVESYPLCTNIEYHSQKVQLEQGIKIQFHDSDEGSTQGLIYGMKFNRI